MWVVFFLAIFFETLLPLVFTVFSPVLSWWILTNPCVCLLQATVPVGGKEGDRTPPANGRLPSGPGPSKEGTARIGGSRSGSPRNEVIGDGINQVIVLIVVSQDTLCLCYAIVVKFKRARVVLF